MLVGIGVALGQAAKPWRSREEEEEDENSRGSVLLWQMVKFCCDQICSRMRLSLFPLKNFLAVTLASQSLRCARTSNFPPCTAG